MDANNEHLTSFRHLLTWPTRVLTEAAQMAERGELHKLFVGECGFGGDVTLNFIQDVRAELARRNSNSSFSKDGA